MKDGGGTTLSHTTYGYDAPGRMSGSTVTPYDANGTAQPATTSTYEYDPDGVRFRQDVTVGSAATAITKYLVDGDNHTGYAQVLEERTTTSGTTETKTYTLGHDVVAQQVETQSGTTQTSGPTLTLLYDGHGSTLRASGLGGWGGRCVAVWACVGGGEGLYSSPFTAIQAGSSGVWLGAA